MAFQVALEGAAVAFVVTQATLFGWLRDRGPAAWRHFIECPLCVGFWTGAGLTAVELISVWSSPLPPLHRTELLQMLAHVVGNGALSGVLAFLAVSVSDYLDAVTDRAKAEKQ